MPVSTSADSAGPVSAKLGSVLQVANKYSWSAENNSSSIQTINVVVRVEIEGKSFVNEIRVENLSLAPGEKQSEKAAVFLSLTPDSTGTYKVKSTTAIEGGAAIGGPKNSVATNWSFMVSA